jgi:hypothetical protein
LITRDLKVMFKTVVDELDLIIRLIQGIFYLVLDLLSPDRTQHPMELGDLCYGSLIITQPPTEQCSARPSWL